MLVVKEELVVNLQLVTSFKMYGSECYIIFNVQTLHEDNMEYFVVMKFETEFQCEKAYLRIIKYYGSGERVLEL